MISRSYFRNFTFILLSLILFVSCSEKENQKLSPTPPFAERIRKELTIHNHTRVDNYYWLNERSNPEVIKYLEEENEYTRKVMAHTEKLQQKLFEEMSGRIKPDEKSAPYKHNGYYYYTRFEEGKDYPLYCRKKDSLNADEIIMLNANEMAAGKKYFTIRKYSVSPNNKLLAFSVDTLSRRKYTTRIKDLETGQLLDDNIENTAGEMMWAKNSRYLFYTTKDSTLRPNKVFRHLTKTNPANDKLVYHEEDPAFTLSILKSKSGKYLFINSTSTLATEWRYTEANNLGGRFRVIVPREEDHEYDVDHLGDNFYIKTNYHSENFKIVSAPLFNPGTLFWRDLVPHRPTILIEDIEIFENYLVVAERESGLAQMRVVNLSDDSEYKIDFGEETFTAAFSDNYEPHSEILRYKYSSLTTPESIYDFNLTTREKKLVKQDEILGGFDKDNYKSERQFAQARDGSMVPISIVFRKGIDKEGDNPLLLYGYGAYGYNVDPDFNPEIFSLLDRDFVYAIAHVRGGQEMGRYWYKEGKLLNKKNTFTDFIDCAEFLINQKYTSEEKLFADGGSAGGLLIGAVVTMRPKLFKGAIAAVPFVDVVTTMLDESIPLTTSEFDEWGNPKEISYYNYMLSYSPYDQVAAKNYPALLVTTGLHDSQVQYWEPAKWVAKLRQLKTDNNLLLLHTNMDAGHSGKSGRFGKYQEYALEYAFLLDQAGVN